MSQAVHEQTTTRPDAPNVGIVIASWVLSFIGLGISIYLTYEHFSGSTTLACTDTGAINCLKVTTSPQSYFLGMPVSVLGLTYYVAALAMYSPWSWWSRFRLLHQVRIAFSVLGILMVLWLLTAELVIIKSICLWCTGVHVVTFCLFVLAIVGSQRALERDDLT
jgi:uncharacterized membrane protein